MRAFAVEEGAFRGRVAVRSDGWRAVSRKVVTVCSKTAGA